jgi:hypothetical protein
MEPTIDDGCRNVLDEYQHRKLLLDRKLADAVVNLVRLHRRSARRIDDDRHRLRAAHAECALENPRNARKRHTLPQRRHCADHAGQSHHRHDRRVAAKARRQPLPQAAQRCAHACFAHVSCRLGHAHGPKIGVNTIVTIPAYPEGVPHSSVLDAVAQS